MKLDLVTVICFVLYSSQFTDSSAPAHEKWSWTNPENLSRALRVELFSFANGNRFLSAVDSNTTNSSVTDGERTIALTVTTLLQRLPIMIAVNETLKDAISQTVTECSPPNCKSESVMQTFLRTLDYEFQNDDHLSETFLVTKSILALYVRQLPVGKRIPYDPRKDDFKKVLFEWSKDKQIRLLLIGNMLLDYSVLFESPLMQTAAFIKALILLSRDTTDIDERTESIFSNAVRKTAEANLNLSVCEDDFDHPNFFWYNDVVNETVMRILDSEIHADAALGEKFDSIKETLLQAREYGFRIQSLLLLVGLTVLSTLIIIALWLTGRYVYRRCRSRYAAQIDEEPIEVELPDD